MNKLLFKKVFTFLLHFEHCQMTVKFFSSSILFFVSYLPLLYFMIYLF